jgi:hypothetical protein
LEPVNLLAYPVATGLALRLRALPMAILIVSDGAWWLTVLLIRNVYGLQ